MPANASKNRRYLLVARPTGDITPDLFKFVTEDVPALQPGEVRVRNQYLSVDPTNRIWMSDMPQYMPPIALGEVVRALGLGVVEESTLPHLRAGDLVTGLLGWQDYSVQSAAGLRKLPTNLDIPVTAFLSVLGLTGCTAYFGLLDITTPKAGETLVVSGAAGAVGSVVAQIGLLAGLRVVGIAGGGAKCAYLKKLGVHATVDYKQGDVTAALKQAAPGGIDIYFDNVGGEISDAVLMQMNLHGRVSLCGLISGYNALEKTPGPANYAQILMKRLQVRGFIASDFAAQWPHAVQTLYTWVKAGKIQYAEHVEHGLENAPQILGKLFDGSNSGKLIIKLT